jgi:hypothetical protein
MYLKLSNAEGELQNIVLVQTCRKNGREIMGG